VIVSVFGPDGLEDEKRFVFGEVAVESETRSARSIRERQGV